MAEYKAVRVEAGRGGWGGPLTIKPTAERPLIYSVTGGGIHPVAQKIADLTGGEAFDGFKSNAPFDKIAVGHRLRRHRPRRRLPDEEGADGRRPRHQPGRPLAMFIKEDIFVSGVGPDNVKEV